jgi:hypothetical protein
MEEQAVRSFLGGFGGKHDVDVIRALHFDRAVDGFYVAGLTIGFGLVRHRIADLLDVVSRQEKRAGSGSVASAVSRAFVICRPAHTPSPGPFMNFPGP